MKIMGLTSHFTGNHDNSAALLSDGQILFAESEERISRIKHDRQFPITAIKHALNFAKLKIDDIDFFASGSPPTNFLKLFSSYVKGFKYTGFGEIFHWFVTRTFLFFKEMGSLKEKNILPQDYNQANFPPKKLVYVSHHLSHAESAYHFSGFDECMVVVLDGYGVNKEGYPLCGSVYLGENGVLKHLEDIPVYASLGLFYGGVTVALGFKLNDGEGKTMGLASFGKGEIVDKLRGMSPFFDGQKWVPRKNWLEVNGVSRTDYFRLTYTYRHLRQLIEEFGAEEVAYASQKVLEEEVEKFFKYLVKKYKQRLNSKKIKVAAAGGVFLNVKMNMALLKKKIISELFIYPNPADGGVAVGAAIAAYKKLGGEVNVDRLETVALGCDFSNQEVNKLLKSFAKKISVKKLNKEFHKTIARSLASGKVVGWFQGRGEWGPRALGYRSVFADPRQIETKERINSKLKERDWFMPFAPAILYEHVDKVLEHGYGTPFMTLTDDVKPKITNKIQAAIHIDKTARSQIVKKDFNPKFWQLIYEFYKITGVPAILNTSFNKHGLPIVHSPREAIEHLLWGCIDELVIGDYLILKR